MNKQKKLLLFCVALVVLIAGASLLYRYLGDKMQENELLGDSQDSQDVDLNDKNSDDEAVDNKTDKDDTQKNDTQKEDTQKEDTQKEDTQKEEAPTLKPARQLRVTDIDGNEVALADFKGKPVVVNFWATWCSICKNEMMDFQMVYDKYKDDVEFMMVSVTDGYRETVKKASEYIDQKGYTFPVYYDTLRDAYFMYNVSAIPVTCFVDAEGNLVKTLKGGLDRLTIERGIEQILGQNATE